MRTEESIDTVELFLEEIRKVPSSGFQKLKQDYVYNCYAKRLSQMNEKEWLEEPDIEREVNEIAKEANKKIVYRSSLVLTISMIVGLMAFSSVILSKT